MNSTMESPSKRRKSVFQRLALFPPILVRLMARRPRGGPLSVDEIMANCDAAGYPMDAFMVHAISQKTNWIGVDIYQAQAFLNGCSMNFIEDYWLWKRATEYLRKVGLSDVSFRYLRRSPDWLTLYQPMILRYAKSMTPSTL